MVSVRITMRNVTGVALITGFTLLTGCGSASGTPEDDRSRPTTTISRPASGGPADSTPTGARRLVLRAWITGGIAGRGGPGALPEFSLYDDASAIAPKGGGFGGPAQPMEYRLTGAALQRLIDEAHVAGLARSRTVERSGVADATYLTLTFQVGGRTATTRIIQVETENDPAERFWSRLHAQGNPGAIGFAPSDLAGGPAPYRPARLAVLAANLGQGSSGTTKDWPFRPLGNGDRVGGWSCTVLTGADQDSATKILATSPDVLWRSGGQTYRVLPRPLLPDESGCRALNTP
jgi:hypothetical protein